MNRKKSAKIAIQIVKVENVFNPTVKNFVLNVLMNHSLFILLQIKIMVTVYNNN